MQAHIAVNIGHNIIPCFIGDEAGYALRAQKSRGHLRFQEVIIFCDHFAFTFRFREGIAVEVFKIEVVEQVYLCQLFYKFAQIYTFFTNYPQSINSGQ